LGIGLSIEFTFTRRNPNEFAKLQIRVREVLGSNGGRDARHPDGRFRNSPFLQTDASIVHCLDYDYFLAAVQIFGKGSNKSKFDSQGH
jgi:hypothetical protein